MFFLIFTPTLSKYTVSIKYLNKKRRLVFLLITYNHLLFHIVKLKICFKKTGIRNYLVIHIGTLLIECVQDNDLDLYNRINIFSMFIHFINQIQDNSIKEKILLNMDSATLSIPVYLQDIYIKWRQ
jgi:hypothetical protein